MERNALSRNAVTHACITFIITSTRESQIREASSLVISQTIAIALTPADPHTLKVNFVVTSSSSLKRRKNKKKYINKNYCSKCQLTLGLTLIPFQRSLLVVNFSFKFLSARIRCGSDDSTLISSWHLHGTDSILTFV